MIHFKHNLATLAQKRAQDRQRAGIRIERAYLAYARLQSLTAEDIEDRPARAVELDVLLDEIPMDELLAYRGCDSFIRNVQVYTAKVDRLEALNRREQVQAMQRNAPIDATLMRMMEADLQEQAERTSAEEAARDRLGLTEPKRGRRR